MTASAEQPKLEQMAMFQDLCNSRGAVGSPPFCGDLPRLAQGSLDETDSQVGVFASCALRLVPLIVFLPVKKLATDDTLIRRTERGGLCSGLC